MVTSSSGRKLSSTTSCASAMDPSASWCATNALTATMGLSIHQTQKPPTRESGALRLRLSAERRDQIRLHLLKLLTPVGPVVGAVGREVEHGIVTTRGDVIVLEGLVGPNGQAFEERGRKVAATQLIGCAVTA